jgi:hypothetical protein
MNHTEVERVADAILYEGYLLYPYRPSAMKNRQRWTFGGVYPEGVGEPSNLHVECLLRAGPKATLRVRVRFLHLLERTADGSPPWQEAVEREVTLEGVDVGSLLEGPRRVPFAFGAGRTVDGEVVRRQEGIAGEVELAAWAAEGGVLRLGVEVRNLTPLFVGQADRLSSFAEGQPGRLSYGEVGRDETLLRALVSTHAILHVQGGAFVSLTDPPQELRAAAAACRNAGAWPVLAGAPGGTDTMLCSPIILYDYPQVAPQSPGDLFDATEIDEILTLRILTLTDDEKREMCAADEWARRLLERTEALAREQLLELHGTVRVGGCGVRPGDRVLLRPRRSADVLDLVLDGKTAIVEAIEEDFEGQVYLSVTIEDDPGRDLGAAGQIAHRFFFRPDEVESIGPVEET